MKKITLVLLIILPLLGFGQTTIASYTFDTTVDGWTPGASATVAYDGTNYFDAAGSLNLTLTAVNKVGKSPNFSIDGAADYTVSFKIKGGPALAKVKGVIRQDGSNNPAPSAVTITGLPSSTGADTTIWYEYSYTWTLTSTSDIQVQIQCNQIGTYYIDDVTIVKEPCAGFAITAADDGGGTASITTVLPCYPEASSVEFTATPSCGDFTFSEWEIDGTPSGISTNPYTYTVGVADAEIKALFTASATAPDTNFDTDTELGNWIGTNSTTAVSGDDLVWTIPVSSQPKITYNSCAFAPTTWGIDKLKIQYTNGTDNTRLRLTHPKVGGTTYINYDGLAISGDATNGVGTIDVVLNHATWIDFLTNIEFLLRNDASNAPANAGVFTIDYIEFYNASAGVIATAGVGTNWNDPATWTGGIVPTLASDAQIDHPVNIDVDAVINNITIANGIQLKVNKAKSLTVNGNLVTDTANSLLIDGDSNEFGSLIANGTVTGNAKMRRYASVSPINDLLSPPFSNGTFKDMEDASIRLFENTLNPGEHAFGPFDNTSGLGSYINYVDPTDDAVVLVSGKGYRAGTDPTTPGTITFKGDIVSELDPDITISITDPAGGSSWNLIGNPYPSYIEFATFFSANSAQLESTSPFNAIYGYDGTVGGWTIWNSLNTTEIITPGQGFFVRSQSGGGTITFTPAMRTIASGVAATDDDFIGGRVANTNIALAKLSLTKASESYFTDIYFVDNQTRGLDSGYDAGAFQGNAKGIYTHLVEDNTGVEIAIQALPYNDFNDVVVPLGVKSDAGVQLTIGLDATTATIPSNINVYLEDNVTNTWTSLNTGDYTFTPSVTLSGTGRFFVHFSSSTLSTDDNSFNGLQIYADHPNKTVVVNGQLSNDTNISIFDMRGRMLLQQDLDHSTTTNYVDVNSLATGVYVVQLSNGTQNKTQKVIIK